MFKIFSHQRNENHNYTIFEIIAHTQTEWLPSIKQTTNDGEDVKRELLNIFIGGDIYLFSNYKNQYEDSSKN